MAASSASIRLNSIAPNANLFPIIRQKRNFIDRAQVDPAKDLVRATIYLIVVNQILSLVKGCGAKSLGSCMVEKSTLVDMTAEIVSAYVGNNLVDPSKIPNLIEEIYAALATVGHEDAGDESQSLVPAVDIAASVSDDYIICLEDGKQFKSLKRHLRTRYAMSPDEYRSKWGLDSDYPMVAPNYAKARSKLAKEMGLGQAKATRDQG